MTEIPKPAPESLKSAVRRLMSDKGRLYADIPHPDFADWSAAHKSMVRKEIIEPHLEHRGGTALEIGAYFATFSHWLFDLGYRVTAVERRPDRAAVARDVRDLCGKTFEIIEGDFTALAGTKFDVVFALNVFHHKLRSREEFDKLAAFLSRLDCELMFFQPDRAKENQVGRQYRSMGPEQFADFVGANTRLPKIEQIGVELRRKIFRLTR